MQSRPSRWKSEPYEVAAGRALAKGLGVSPVVGAILARRGFAEVDEARRFLSAEEAHDPRSLPGVPAACELILDAWSGALRSPSSATTTWMACAPPRSCSARCARWAPTPCGSCPAGSTRGTAFGVRGGAARRARGEAARDGGLRDHGGRARGGRAGRGTRGRGDRPSPAGGDAPRLHRSSIRRWVSTAVRSCAHRAWC